jgi:hypothetical protein
MGIFNCTILVKAGLTNSWVDLAYDFTYSPIC